MPREKAGEPLRADIAPAGDRGDEHGGRRRTSPQRQSLQFAHGERRSRRDSARRYAHELRSSEHAAAPAPSGESLIKLADSCLPNLLADNVCENATGAAPGAAPRIAAFGDRPARL